MPVKLNSSGGGSVTLDVPATATATNLTVPAANGTIVVADNSGNVTYSGATTFSGNATFNAALIPSSSFLRNRIINGAMVIDQRNAGASVTPSTNAYTLDRWEYGVNGTPGSRFTIQRNAGSVTPPAGFAHYLGATSTGANVPSSTDRFGFFQNIEGFNVADFDFGLATARTVTLSFWVRSSLTGTFGGVFANSGYTRCYVYSYTINAANTWEFKTITVPGDTSGTWLRNNSMGLAISFAMAAGSSNLATPGSWLSSAAFAPTGQVNVSATNGATFYITGVQLEVGSAATPFERRQHGQELLLCQRYYQRSNAGSANSFDLNGGDNLGFSHPTANFRGGAKYFVPMRAAPTLSIFDSSGNAARVSLYNAGLGAWVDNQAIGVGPVTTATGFYLGHNITNSVETQYAYAASAEF